MTPIPARVIEPSAPSWTIAATPAVAKSPTRRSSFVYAPPNSLGRIPNRTSTRTSVGSIAVVNVSRKKSRAAISRSPAAPRQTTVAFTASRAAGQSDAGSAWATEPPIVPQLRTCGSPIPPETSWISG